jgi:anti-sigma factor RsiW
MEHAKDIELIELAGGRLDADRREAVQAHVQTCAACQAKLTEVRATWELLGAWEVPAPQGLDLGKVHGVPVPAARPGQMPTIRRIDARVLLRIAASIGVAALIGYTAGRWSIVSNHTPVSLQPPSYLSVLGLQAGESFSSLVLDEEASAVEGG